MSIGARTLRPDDAGFVNLEHVLVSREGFGLTTATPVQRAVCRAIQGIPLGDLWDNADVRNAFGGTEPPTEQPEEFFSLSAIRCGKTTTIAAAVFALIQNADLSHITPGDEVRVPVVSVDKDTATATFSQIVGKLQASKLLRRTIIGEPTQESIWVRNIRYNVPVEIRVTALSKAGSTLVGRWLVALVLDEVTRMPSQDEGVANIDGALNATAGRLLGPVFGIGSPYAPFGVAYERFTQHFGKPSAKCVVTRSPGWVLHPQWWTPARMAALRERDPRAYETDVCANFADAEESMFSSRQYDAVTREHGEALPPVAVQHYVAAMDPATRGNAWTLVVLTCDAPGHYQVVLHRQWIGSSVSPLSPGAVMAEVSRAVTPYRATRVLTDQYMGDALIDTGRAHGLSVQSVTITSAEKFASADNLRQMIANASIEMPQDPVMRGDVLAAKRRLTSNGVTINLPHSGDGRHCDYLPALCLATRSLPPPPNAPVKQLSLEERMIERMLAEDRRSDAFGLWQKELSV